MKRKSRNKLAKDKSINILQPLQLDKLGSVDDPCFGKLHNPTADECGMCGDSEICAIVCSQKLHAKRAKIEKEKDFKDLQNLECTWKDVSKAIKRILKKEKYKKGMPLPILKGRVSKKLGIHVSDFDKFFAEVIKKQPKIKFTHPNTVTYKP